MYEQLDVDWMRDVIAQCIIGDCKNDAVIGLLCRKHGETMVQRHRVACDCRRCTNSVEPQAPNETAPTAGIGD